MADSLTPSGYMKMARGQFKDLAPAVVDKYIQILRNKEAILCNKLEIPSHIPAKYHPAMQRLWLEILANVFFARASEKIRYAERFKLSQKMAMEK